MPSLPVRGFGEDGLLVTGGVGASEGAVVNSAAIATTQRAQTSSIDVVTIAVLHPRKRRMVAHAVNAASADTVQWLQTSDIEALQVQGAFAVTLQSGQVASAEGRQSQAARARSLQAAQTGSAAAVQVNAAAGSGVQGSQTSAATAEVHWNDIFAYTELDADLAIALFGRAA